MNDIIDFLRDIKSNIEQHKIVSNKTEKMNFETIAWRRKFPSLMLYRNGYELGYESLFLV